MGRPRRDAALAPLGWGPAADAAWSRAERRAKEAVAWADAAVEPVRANLQLVRDTEVSPSGTGVKVFGRGTWSGDWHRRPHAGGGEVEVYDGGRYFAVTD